MSDTVDRLTIDKVDLAQRPDSWKPHLADYGRRRHLSYTLDFDNRAKLFEEPGEGWSDEIKALYLDDRKRVTAGLAAEFGTAQLEAKVRNFIDIGAKPLSVLAYHNRLFDEVRRSFVIGAYYPALVGACTLGERILNHLILDLRDQYSRTAEYKRVHRKESFDDWRVVIDTLKAWNILLPKAVTEFLALKTIRHRSIHFNPSTYSTLRADALAAIHHIREIIDQQFTAFGARPWFIAGTKGQVFIKRDWEQNPLVRTYYLPNCPLLGPFFAISFERGLKFYDHHDYGDGAWTDDEFAQVFNNRTLEQIATTEVHSAE